MAKKRIEFKKHWLMEYFDRYYFVPKGKTRDEVVRERARRYRETGTAEDFSKFIAMFGLDLFNKAKNKMQGSHDPDDALDPALAEIAKICRSGTSKESEAGQIVYPFENPDTCQTAYARKVLSNHISKYYEDLTKVKLEKAAQATGQPQNLKELNERRKKDREGYLKKQQELSEAINQNQITEEDGQEDDPEDSLSNSKKMSSQVPDITKALYCIFDPPEDILLTKERLDAIRDAISIILNEAEVYFDSVSRKPYHRPIFECIIFLGLSYEETAKIVFPTQYEANRVKARDHTKYIFKSLCSSIVRKALRRNKELRKLLDAAGINYAKYLPTHR